MFKYNPMIFMSWVLIGNFFYYNRFARWRKFLFVFLQFNFIYKSHKRGHCTYWARHTFRKVIFLLRIFFNLKQLNKIKQTGFCQASVWVCGVPPASMRSFCINNSVNWMNLKIFVVVGTREPSRGPGRRRNATCQTGQFIESIIITLGCRLSTACRAQTQFGVFDWFRSCHLFALLTGGHIVVVVVVLLPFIFYTVTIWRSRQQLSVSFWFRTTVYTN